MDLKTRTADIETRGFLGHHRGVTEVAAAAAVFGRQGHAQKSFASGLQPRFAVDLAGRDPFGLARHTFALHEAPDGRPELLVVLTEDGSGDVHGSILVVVRLGFVRGTDYAADRPQLPPATGGRMSESWRVSNGRRWRLTPKQGPISRGVGSAGQAVARWPWLDQPAFERNRSKAEKLIVTPIAFARFRTPRTRSSGACSRKPPSADDCREPGGSAGSRPARVRSA